MENKPKLTVSGYRGIWGESLTDEIVENYTKAFIKFIKENINEKPTILLGRDGRESGPEIKKIIIKTLEILGVSFIDGDILPTPTVLFAVRKHKYDGAIIITASHNPREYDGLKFVTNKALFTNEKEVELIKENYNVILREEKTKKLHQKILSGNPNNFLLKIIYPLSALQRQFASQSDKKQSNLLFITRFISLRKFPRKNILIPLFPQEHANEIIKNINVEKIRSRKFKVGVDMINASACVLDPYLFEKLGVELIPINNIPNGKFGHNPEPLRENLEDIGRIVKENNCNLGFAHDPDADRLVVINENGVVISEEYTLALGVEAVLSKNLNNKVVVNMSTSQMSKDIAEKYNGECFRTKVGEANVVAGIIENNAIIGGEGGGGIIYPKINMARDSFVSLALILELLAEKKQTITECVNSLPHYEMKKDKVPVVGSLDEMYLKMKNHFGNCEINELDGLRLDFSDNSWIHLRPSNTEPIVRLIGEAKTKEQIEKLFEETKKIFEKIYN